MAENYDNDTAAATIDPTRPVPIDSPIYGTPQNLDIDDTDRVSTPVMPDENPDYNNSGLDRNLDNNNLHDPAKGAAIGAVGGAIVGGLAGGPVGAVIGGVAGAAASGGAVAATDEHDNDDSPRERHIDPVTGQEVISDTTDYRGN